MYARGNPTHALVPCSFKHQNGSIMDALLLWKRNVDKRTEGVDECTICYSVWLRAPHIAACCGLSMRGT